MILSEEDIDALINNKPFTLGSCRTQQEEETMNDNINTTFTPVLVKLTDAEVEKLLELKGESLDGTAAYLTEADETADEPTPTIH